MTPLERLTEAVDALTRPRTHREALTPDMAPLDAVTRRPIHGAVITKVASLLDQLTRALEPGGTTDSGHRKPASTPAARLEALSALLVIDRECTDWMGFLALADRHLLAANLNGLVGAATSLDTDDPELANLATSAKRWMTLANVTTGWEVAPWRPDNTCPLCAVRGSLRVRVGDGTSEASATCVGCWQHWTAETIGLLADHIRWENGDLEPDVTMGATA